jgi:hypothetical protein
MPGASEYDPLRCGGHVCRSCGRGRNLFFRSLPFHAKLLVPLLILAGRDYFASDWELIHGACSAMTKADIEEEIHCFSTELGNRHWLRRRLRLRLSVRRLQRSLASPRLPARLP